LVGFEARKSALDELGVGVIAASVDELDNGLKVANDVSFPVAYGITREIGDKLGSWWETGRDFIQPSEFIIDRDGKVILSSYSAGPLARLLADDVLDFMGRMIKYKVL
jgi:peroxiredoxin